MQLGVLGSAATGCRRRGDVQPESYTQSKLLRALLPTVLKESPMFALCTPNISVVHTTSYKGFWSTFMLETDLLVISCIENLHVAHLPKGYRTGNKMEGVSVHGTTLLSLFY